MLSSVLAAEPLKDLQHRLVAARSEQPIRVKVDVELEHKEKALLHREGFKRRGQVIVEAGPQGLHMWEQIWRNSTSSSSFWGSQRTSPPGPLLAETEARELIDSAEWIESFLLGLILVDDRPVVWEGKEARLLVVRPADLPPELEPGKASTEGEGPPVILEAKIWLGADGLPLALESTTAARLPGLTTTQHQTLTFQQAGGRLLVARSTETSTETAQTGIRGSDSKTVKVTVD
ncbi:MAG TPA: hypothetical protein VIJ61_03045 [Thermoanaerobaculia bacterium]